MGTWAAVGHDGRWLLIGCRLHGSTASVLAAKVCGSDDPTFLPQPFRHDNLLAVAAHSRCPGAMLSTCCKGLG